MGASSTYVRFSFEADHSAYTSHAGYVVRVLGTFRRQLMALKSASSYTQARCTFGPFQAWTLETEGQGAVNRPKLSGEKTVIFQKTGVEAPSKHLGIQ